MPLNPSQETAVNTCKGFQLILAGPGSGKTRVITEKILHLIDKGIKPENILALTFSDKAASEMSGRIETQRPHLDLAIHTFHSFCLDILKENVLASGMPVPGGIISRTAQLIEQMIARIGAGEFPARPDERRCGWCPYGDLCGSREDERSD
jgi:DNA helicase-2/ATP-dependent DNA helicase PcrA